MRILLDTHAFIWAVGEPDRLPAPIREAVADPGNDVLVSTVCAWEITIKVALRRLEFQLVDDAMLDRFGMRHHAVGLRHTTALAALPDHHRDPFDRMLIAQAVVDDLTIVTRDAAFADYDVHRFWS